MRSITSSARALAARAGAVSLAVPMLLGCAVPASAVIDAFQSPTIQKDLAAFDAIWNIPAPPSFNIIPPPGGLTPFVATDPNQVGWSSEISLDVEWAHAVAPGANIDLVLAKSNDDVDI